MCNHGQEKSIIYTAICAICARNKYDICSNVCNLKREAVRSRSMIYTALGNVQSRARNKYDIHSNVCNMCNHGQKTVMIAKCERGNQQKLGGEITVL